MCPGRPGPSGNLPGKNPPGLTKNTKNTKNTIDTKNFERKNINNFHRYPPCENADFASDLSSVLILLQARCLMERCA